MTRPIRFRAWNEQNKTMDYTIGICIAGEAPLNEFLESMDNLMQYTGLHDQNGKPIFEGDVVHIKSVHDDKEFNLPVIFEKGAFFVKGSGELFLWNDVSEIIGNLYENPELLEKP